MFSNAREPRAPQPITEEEGTQYAPRTSYLDFKRGTKYEAMGAPGMFTKKTIQQSHLRELQKVVLYSQVFPNVRLVKHDHCGGVEIFAVLGRLRRHAEAEWHVAHAIHHGAPVLGSILRYSPKAGLLHVVAVQEGHLRAGLYPHLVLRFVRAAGEWGKDVGDRGMKKRCGWSNQDQAKTMPL